MRGHDAGPEAGYSFWILLIMACIEILIFRHDLCSVDVGATLGLKRGRGRALILLL
jgi:hypothetical protein